jgi:fructose-bisphosphate aldolase class I
MNADRLSTYARICQERGIVPIVEPEVLMTGRHSSQECFDTTVATHRALFAALREQHVFLPGLILKSNMVVPGEDSGETVTAEHIAKETVHALRMNVPMEVPGVVFLSGGMSEIEATRNLNAMNKMYHDLPWRLTYSYGRALQTSALDTWRGQQNNVLDAQQAFLNRAFLNSLASMGEYTGE